jgi:hypothetical protein
MSNSGSGRLPSRALRLMTAWIVMVRPRRLRTDRTRRVVRLRRARRVQKTRSCSLSVVLVEQTVEPVASEHTALVVTDDDWTGRCIR